MLCTIYIYILLAKCMCCHFRNHFFDLQERKRTKRRKSKKAENMGKIKLQYGERGVREHHRTVMTKVLPTDVLGIQIKE